MRVNIQNEVNPHFKSVWTTRKPYNILKGGRNSFKSSVVVLLLVFYMLGYMAKGSRANIVVIRKYGVSLRDTVYPKIIWALKKFGIESRFKMTVSPLKIINKKTGGGFHFYGLDDFQKMKSNDLDDVIAVWYEEAAEFANSEEFDQTNATFMRQKHKDADSVKIFWTYNPPRNPYHWINKWAAELQTAANYLVHSSTYLDDKLGFVTLQMIEEIERIKSNDLDYYKYLYLGEAVGLGSNVYNMALFHRLETLDDLAENERVIAKMYALDGGHAQSATACCLFGLTNKSNFVLLDTYYYSPAGKVNKLAPSQLSQTVHEFVTRTEAQYKNAITRQMTIDSAEAALRNQYFLDYGTRWHPVAKGKKQSMIDDVTSLLADGRFYYLDTENNAVFIEEHQKYRYDEKTIDTAEPKVIKIDDHTPDVMQYAVRDNARDLGLRR